MRAGERAVVHSEDVREVVADVADEDPPSSRKLNGAPPRTHLQELPPRARFDQRGQRCT